MPGRRTFLTKSPSAWSLLVPVVALLAGVLFATSLTTSQGSSLRSAPAGIPDLIREGTRSNAIDSRRIDELQDEVDALTRRAAEGNQQVERDKQAADALAPAAARTPVTGPVVEVTLNDAPINPHRLPAGASVDDIVVHQQDVQAVVNALWAGGAEALMLMDQRVISTSAVRCVGNTLILKGRVYSPPFVIKAIGDPVALTERLAADPAIQIYQQYVVKFGLGYDVTNLPSGTFPAYSGSISPQYASVPK